MKRTSLLPAAILIAAGLLNTACSFNAEDSNTGETKLSPFQDTGQAFEIFEDTELKGKSFELDTDIITNGYDLTLEFDEIVSSSGRILTFKKNQTARSETIGRSGGKITIKARRVFGKIPIILRGEKGGQGKKGDRGLSGEPAFDREPVTYSFSDMITAPGVGSFPISSYCRGTKPYKRIQNSRARFKRAWRKVNPTRGHRGGSGKTGFPGGNGARGGNAGELYLFTPHLDLFEIKNIPGPGGQGGIGGDGGEGGLGGKFAKLNLGRFSCKTVGINGIKGKVGNIGSIGGDGGPGKKAKIFLNGKEMNLESH